MTTLGEIIDTVATFIADALEFIRGLNVILDFLGLFNINLLD